MSSSGEATFRYRITVSGDLDESLSTYLVTDDSSVELLRSEAVLEVRLRDPRALGRVLDALYSLRLPLISVELLGPEAEETTHAPERSP